MLALFLYIFGGLFAFCGIVNWYEHGYTDQYLSYVLWGLSPFVIRGLVILHDNWKAAASWEKKKKEMEESTASKQSANNNKHFDSVHDSYYVSNLAQAKIEWLERELELYKAGYDANSVMQAEIERLERENAEYASKLNINQKALLSELANTKAKLRKLEAEHASLQSSFETVISTPVVDEEAEAEIRWLREENAKLQSSLLASENAVSVLNQQLDDLRKTTG